MSTFKSILIPAITLAAGLAAGYWWAQSGNPGAAAGKPNPDASRFVCNSSTDVPEKDLLTVDTAFNMIARYGKRLPPDSAQSRSIWFSTERIHALLCVMKRDSMSGVRFYYAKYANDYPSKLDEGSIGHNPIKPYWGQTTLVLVTTRAQGKKHLDHIKVKEGGNGRPHIGMILTSPPPDDPENNGELCPPPKNCFSKGAYFLAPNVDSTKKHIYN
ncbi:flagellar basal body-associated FliL family protein [Chitinophaga rhizosphaerae]|uniref:hypothetical protein n=1 Tax=Chitinophaga rhizosphaerae TaxID=1864947 RepID=UPI000F7FDB38|nr:hypothetical protein [Chitinophaga rhizosphaerae]